jgi:hypothetical protein
MTGVPFAERQPVCNQAACRDRFWQSFQVNRCHRLPKSMSTTTSPPRGVRNRGAGPAAAHAPVWPGLAAPPRSARRRTTHRVRMSADRRMVVRSRMYRRGRPAAPCSVDRCRGRRDRQSFTSASIASSSAARLHRFTWATKAGPGEGKAFACRSRPEGRAAELGRSSTSDDSPS